MGLIHFHPLEFPPPPQIPREIPSNRHQKPHGKHGEVKFKVIRGPLPKDSHQHIPAVMTRQHVLIPIELVRQLYRADGGRNLHDDPGEDEEWSPAHCESVREHAVNDVEVDHAEKPRDEPAEDVLGA